MSTEFHGIGFCLFPGGTLNNHIGRITAAEIGNLCDSHQVGEAAITGADTPVATRIGASGLICHQNCVVGITATSPGLVGVEWCDRSPGAKTTPTGEGDRRAVVPGPGALLTRVVETDPQGLVEPEAEHLFERGLLGAAFDRGESSPQTHGLLLSIRPAGTGGEQE